MKKKTETLSSIAQNLPEKPGVYQFLDSTGAIIYVGKAKSLKKRVASYFRPEETLPGKTRVMLRRATDLRSIIVDNEYDALLLENNLIKKHQPRYNILLKDDKTYPWICIKNEPFPRIFPTRNIVRDGSDYFGPYASVRMMNTLLDLVRQLFPLRNCNLNLSHQNIAGRKFKVCLEYQIGNCLGPCEGLQSEEDYKDSIAAVKEIIRGNTVTVIQKLKSTMMEYADKMEFEKAQLLKEKMELLEKYQSKSLIVSPQIHNVDVFSIIDDRDSAYVNYMKVMNGAIIQAHTIELKKRMEESIEDLLQLAFIDFQERFPSEPDEILLSIDIRLEIPGVRITVPKIGDKKKLIELSERNAKYFKIEREKQRDLVDPDHKSKRILEQAMKDLRLSALPDYIECFDNSNIQGSYPVSSMVVFKEGRADKKSYRHYNIKSVSGPDDYASMEEVVGRRYKRLIEEGSPLPKLIIIDGGKGQLNSAQSILKKLGLVEKIKMIGIAKRLEEIYFPGDPIPLYLDKKSTTLRLIQQLRDEAHRFGITHHRKRMEKGTIRTELSDIKGIGPATSSLLLKHFKSVENIKRANIEEISRIIGPARAKILAEFLQTTA